MITKRTGYKITFKIVRSFSSPGFIIFSPKLNGFAAEIYFICFAVLFWGKGDKWVGFRNYWGS